MEHDRLSDWLGLPPGPWPPDHYALIGLARGTGDFSDIEARVLDRMELLRPHQLLNPELVTEGMNRLAQALVCLTDPVARAAYDRALGIPPPPFEVVEDEEPRPSGPAEASFAPGLLPPGEPQRPACEVVWEPELDPLPYDVVPAKAYEVVLEEDEVFAEELPAAYEVVEELPPAYEVVPGPARRPRPPPLPPPLSLPPPTPPPLPARAAAPKSRRALYRRLATLRRALRAWNALRPVFGTPTEGLATPIAVLLFVRALAEARTALPGVADVTSGTDCPGGTVAAIVWLPHALHAVRVLQPVQRVAVAQDWQRGCDALAAEHTRLRELVRAGRVRPPANVAVQFCRELRRTPEWCILVLGLAALLFALLRRNS